MVPSKGSTDHYFIASILDFKERHKPFQNLIMVCAICITPVYLFKLHIFKLFDSVAFVIQGRETSLLSLILFLSETLVLLYASLLVIEFYNSQAKVQSVKKYIGVHGCIIFTKVPAHLLYDERPSETSNDDKSVFAKFEGFPESIDEFINQLPDVEALLSGQINEAELVDRTKVLPDPSLKPIEDEVQNTVTLLEILRQLEYPKK